jgi:hypothetical protein
MGAEFFGTYSKGKTAREAFTKVKNKAYHNYGHGGYTGSIAEKNTFTVFDVPEGFTPAEYAAKMIKEDDSKVSDKWGPAGCIFIRRDNDENVYLFFGWASS